MSNNGSITKELINNLRCSVNKTRSLVLLVALTSWLGACETVDKDGISGEGLWGEAGSVAYPRAARRMSNESPAGQPLENREREALRPIFQDLVDRVIIHWDSRPLDEVASDETGVTIGSGETDGQAFGLDIYIRGPRANWPDRNRIQLLIHEITHSEQFERLGSDLAAFGYEYFRQYYLAGQVYELNQLEQDAMNKAEREIEATMQRFNTTN
jgi:hypothetical protein